MIDSEYFDSAIALILSKKDNVDLYEKKDKWIKLKKKLLLLQ